MNFINKLKSIEKPLLPFCSFISFFVLLSLGATSCSFWGLHKTDAVSNILFVQDGHEYKVKEGGYEVIEVKNAPFSFHFTFPRFEDTQISDCVVQLAAVTKPEILEQVAVNMPLSQVEFFSPATGMAAPRYGGYEYLYIVNDAHHFLVYDGVDTKRLTPISQSERQFKLAFDVNKLFVNGAEIPIEDSSLDTLYLAILINHNNDDFIDEGELTKLIIQLK